MFLTKILFGAVLLADILALGYTLINGDFFADGKILLSLPWGRYSLIDIYVMFGLFSTWIFHRTENKFLASLFTILTSIFGSVFAVGYIFVQLLTCDDSWSVLWNGRPSLQRVRLADDL